MAWVSRLLLAGRTKLLLRCCASPCPCRAQKFFVDPRTGLPVFDIYAKSGQALADILDKANGADTVVFDIQDIGARFYTYIWTLHDVLQAALLAKNITKVEGEGGNGWMGGWVNGWMDGWLVGLGRWWFWTGPTRWEG